jgi:hypothetical protein
VTRYGDGQVRELDLQCDIEYRNLGLAEAFNGRDLEAFDDVAVSCFYYYNRFPRSMRHLRNRWTGNLFDLFSYIGQRTKNYLRATGHRPSNTDSIEGFQDEILRIFGEVLDNVGAGPVERAAFGELFKLDLFRLLVLRSPQRERIFRQVSRLRVHREPESLTDTTRLAKSTYGRDMTIPFAPRDLSRLHEARESLTGTPARVYLHAPYGHADASVRLLTEKESSLLEQLPSDRGLRFQSLVNSTVRLFGGEESAVREELAGIVAEFRAEGVVAIVG